MLANKHTPIVDMQLLLKDAGALTASAALQVGSSNRIIDLNTSGGTPTAGMTAGADAGELNIVIDVSAIDLSSTNEAYTIHLQGSSSSTFASDIANLASLELNAAPTGSATVVGAVGRHLMIAPTWKNGVSYRYIRGYLVAAGTTPSINFTMAITKDMT